MLKTFVLWAYKSLWMRPIRYPHRRCSVVLSGVPAGGTTNLCSSFCPFDLHILHLYQTSVLLEFKTDQNWGALIWNMLNRSQPYFAPAPTVTLSWRVQYFIVIGWAYFKAELSKFCLISNSFGKSLVGRAPGWCVILYLYGSIKRIIRCFACGWAIGIT